jgi:thiaminase
VTQCFPVALLTEASGGFIEYLLERDDVQKAWHEYTHHDFVQRMGDGTLPADSFKHYMVQDYLYLVGAIITLPGH